MMKKLLLSLFLFSYVSLSPASAENLKSYPNISGRVWFDVKDNIITSSGDHIHKNNGRLNIEPYFWLNMNKNWSIQTGIKISPISKRNNNSAHPERYRTILSGNRKIHVDDEGLFVEQLKVQFENKNMKFFFGKFNPSFGTAFRKEKRIGVFTTDFTKDYQLREKIGLGASALLKNNKITINTFFNDHSALSNSAFNERGRDTNDNIAGGNSSLTSYSLTAEGKDFLEIKNLSYNLGYIDLDVKKSPYFKRERGAVAGLEYSIPVSTDISLIPFLEAVKINNLSGFKGRDAFYVTTSLFGKYKGWSAGVTSIVRDIDGSKRDSELQYSVGYRFSHGIAFDITRMDLKENGNKATVVGASLSYIYEF